MEQHIVNAVVYNALKHEAKYARPINPQEEMARNLLYLAALTEEVGEVARAVQDKGEHPKELEIIQIAGICLIWLQALGITEEDVRYLEKLDRMKHP